MKYLPVVDDSACSAHGDCVHLAPGLFQLDDDVATVIGTGPLDELVAVADACPSGAISVVEADTGAWVYP